VADDGLGFAALSDRGAIIEGRFRRDEAGRITRVDTGGLRMLEVPPGPEPDDFRTDTEGLAADGGGGFYVSTESVTRVLFFAPGATRPDVLPSPRDFADMDENGGLEGLAIGPEGAIYTLPEVSHRTDATAPLYRYRNGIWDRPALIPVRDGFLPVGADFGPDGKLYLLERKFFGLGGFATRVRRLSLRAGGAPLEETLVETRAGSFGNLEGIAVWRDGAGDLRLMMISDDNFLPVLGTEVVEFRVPD
jgi:hypothetical protein